MKEVRYFYDPALTGDLPKEEAQHAVRVLRLDVGDEINLMDGLGNFCRAEITSASNHRCTYSIVERQPQQLPGRDICIWLWLLRNSTIV